jgi:hypothetical protein
MTTNVLRGRRAARGRRHEAEPAPLPIGGEDSEIFNCPTCSRPLAAGARRCPGCRTRLLLGVPLKRAGVFVAAGIALGMVLTTAFVAVSIGLGRPADAAAGPTPLPAATAGAPAVSPPPVATVGPPLPAIPTAAVAALERTAQMNARLAAHIPALTAALAEPSLDTFDVASILRSMTADAAYAAGAAERLGTWDDAADVSAGLGSVYAQMRATALEALSKSLASENAYRTAATRMLVVLAGLAPLDAASRDLAAEAGIELPAVPFPDAPPAVSPDPVASVAPAP